MGIQIVGQIEKVNGKELYYGEFVERYMAKNEPVILTGLMDEWRACKDWVTDNDTANLTFFSTHFGNSRVQVVDCGATEFTDQKRMEMTVSQFINSWLEVSSNVDGLSCEKANEKHLLYLKDWHFVKEYPEYVAYQTPLFFQDDWLNLYLDHHHHHHHHVHVHDDADCNRRINEINCSDYRFVYIGCKGSWTPLHADVFRSHSWSANVCGKKRWLLLSPQQSELVFDRNLKSCVYDIFDNVDELKYPGFKNALWLESIQLSDEIIFVPSGWYHQVHNLEDAISINHNWFSASNLSSVWDLLVRDYNEAKGYIEDIRDICDDFEGLCQKNLAANTGMNFLDWFVFLSRVFLANVVLLRCHGRCEMTKLCSSSRVAQHCASNLEAIRNISQKMKSMDSAVANLGFVDSRETVDDPDFLAFCHNINKMYMMMHQEQNWICDVKIDLIADCSFDSHICTAADLDQCIAYALGECSNACSGHDLQVEDDDG